MPVLDHNGVHLSRGMRVVGEDSREGVIVGLLAPYNAFVRWDDDDDDEPVLAHTLITVGPIIGRRR